MNPNNCPMTLLAFNKLFAEWHDRFVRFANTYVDDYMEAEDIVMDAMTYYWENRVRLEFMDNPSAYILTIIKNKCLNHLRDRQCYLNVSEKLQEHAVWKLSMQIATLEACNPDELLSKEMKERIAYALKKLPEKTRKIFILHRFEEKSYREIALEMNMSVKGVEYHMGKAVDSLKKNLKDFLPLLVYLIYH